VSFCLEDALEVLTVEINLELARDALWRVLLVRWVYPYFALGDALAFSVRDAPITKYISIGPRPLSEIPTSDCAHIGKQNEFAWGRSAINSSQEDSNAIAIQLKAAGGRGHMCS